MTRSPRLGPPASPPRSGLKIAVLLGSTALALVAAEAVFRARNPFGFRQRGNTLVLPAHKVYDIATDPASRSDQLDPHIVHSKNSLGFRGPEPPPDFADRLTLVAVGGSTTECFYLSDGKDWPARLAARLQGRLRDVWVNNAGLDGHSTFGHLVLTREVLAHLEPKVALYLVGINDMFTDAPRDLDRVERNPFAVLANHSELAATLLNLRRWQRTQAIEDLGAMPKPVALRDRPHRAVPEAEAARLWREQDSRLGAYRERLERIVGTNRGSGIATVLVTQPTLLGGVDRRTGLDTRTMEVEIWETIDGDLAWRLIERYNDVTRTVAGEHDLPLVDLAHLLAKDSTYFYDFFHFTNEGADEVGAILYRELLPWLAESFPSYRREDG